MTELSFGTVQAFEIQVASGYHIQAFSVAHQEKSALGSRKSYRLIEDHIEERGELRSSPQTASDL